MKPTQSLPETYQQDGILDLSKDKRLMIMLNLIGMVVFLLSWVAFLNLAGRLRGEEEFNINFGALAIPTSILIAILAVVVHEVIHGISFWGLTGARPQFGFKGVYAYAALPDWYLPRKEYFIVALAPLVIITIAGILLIPVVTLEILPLLLIGVIFNFAGSIGDVAIVIWLLRKPQTVYINDFGDGVITYCCETERNNKSAIFHPS